MIRTLRNEAIVNVAASAGQPTSEREVRYFVKNLAVAAFAIVDPVGLELYGTRTYVLDEQKLARAYHARNLGRGFDLALALAAERVEYLNSL